GDQKVAKNWEKTKMSDVPSINIQNPTILESGSIYGGTINGGTDNMFISKKRDREKIRIEECFPHDVIPRSQHEQAHTPERHITPEDEEEKESSLYDTFPVHVRKRPEPKPFLKTKENLNQIAEEIGSFEKGFALHFVNHMVELIDDVNLFNDSMSEGTYIVNVLAPILGYFFNKKKRDWLVAYGETCLEACAIDINSNKKDDERRTSGKKIDTIISMREEDK
ncbi:4811_t:CDS:2, partial [Funneliformis geosporum]